MWPKLFGPSRPGSPNCLPSSFRHLRLFSRTSLYGYAITIPRIILTISQMHLRPFSSSSQCPVAMAHRHELIKSSPLFTLYLATTPHYITRYQLSFYNQNNQGLSKSVPCHVPKAFGTGRGSFYTLLQVWGRDQVPIIL